MATCADRRGPAFESRPAHTSPDFGPARKSAIPGDTVGGSLEIGISGSRRDVRGGVFWIPAARVLASPSRVLQELSSENGARKLTNCADRRGPAFEGRLAEKSPDFGPTRKSAISGNIVGEIRKSGFRGLVRMSWGGRIGFRRRVF